MEERVKRIGKTYGEQILLALIAIPIGALIGAIDAVFGHVLLAITGFRSDYALFLLPTLPLAGVIIAFCYKKFGGASSKGMGLVFEAGNGMAEKIPWRLVPFVVCSTWLTHLSGGSAGREGVAVQIGATVSHGIGRRLPFKDASSIFLVVGMAAGFAGLFRTPIAATFFALEVLVAGELRYRALFPAVSASITASVISGLMGLGKFTFALKEAMPTDFGMSWDLLWKLLVLGLIFGVVGGLFAWALKLAKKFTGKIKNPILRIALMGIGLAAVLMLLYQGRYSGLGTNLIQSSFHGETIYYWDWILKAILTILTLAAGFQGGEVTPLFSIGASLGVALSGIFGLPVVFVAALGYAAVFGGATNTLLAPILIGGEIFGYEYLPCFFIVCVIAYIFNLNKSIYSPQKIRAI